MDRDLDNFNPDIRWKFDEPVTEQWTITQITIQIPFQIIFCNV